MKCGVKRKTYPAPLLIPEEQGSWAWRQCSTTATVTDRGSHEWACRGAAVPVTMPLGQLWQWWQAVIALWTVTWCDHSQWQSRCKFQGKLSDLASQGSFRYVPAWPCLKHIPSGIPSGPAGLTFREGRGVGIYTVGRHKINRRRIIKSRDIRKEIVCWTCQGPSVRTGGPR
jgi:hypothetical protein